MSKNNWFLSQFSRHKKEKNANNLHSFSNKNNNNKEKLDRTF